MSVVRFLAIGALLGLLAGAALFALAAMARTATSAWGVTYGGWPSTLVGDLAALVAHYDVLTRR